jgi:hypothetical protein
MEPIKADPRNEGRLHTVFVVQRRLSGTDVWGNCMAFTQREMAEKYQSTSEKLSVLNVMRVEELLIRV